VLRVTPHGPVAGRVASAGLSDNTVVIFVGDNGTAMPRGKT